MGLLSCYWNAHVSYREHLSGHAMAIHQFARFSVFPMRLHEQAIMRICWYLLSTHEKGMMYKPDSSKGLEVYVDADFACRWDPADPGNADNIYSRTGFVI
jgi:hypothetical protein